MRSGVLYGCGLLALVVLCAGCERKHVPVDSVPQRAYPSCGDDELPEGRLIASGVLRSGPRMREQGVLEQFALRRHDCLRIIRVHHTWRLATNDIDVVYDESLRPLRVWRRMQVPGRKRPKVDIRRYELRGDQVTKTHRKPDGELVHEILKGPKPQAVIGPGRALVTMWIRKAGLEVGERVREPVLAFRKNVETLEPVTLRRDPDHYVDALERKVRVYTVFGRESVFADENDVVIGDLAGLLPHAAVSNAPAPAMPELGKQGPRSDLRE